MKYLSTRGEAPPLGFEDVLLAGLAGDGGLYVPQAWPQISADELKGLRGAPYTEVAFRVMAPFIGGAVPERDLRRMIGEAYAGFSHPAVTPLRQMDASLWLLELYRGPTLAFKDVAMQLLARLMDYVLERRGARVLIVGATSGDTGGAAIEAFRDSRRARLVILHPAGRVSPVQRRQMTTVPGEHLHNVAIAGNFDDCQALLKAMFADRAFREKHRLAGVNSINFARIMAQIVYYFAAALALGSPARTVSFAVPTGNFGDVFAGWAAKRMGLPIERLLIATNVNDILDRALATGRYEVRSVVATQSPSMDIQVSSNFERLLFEAHGRDPQAVRRMMQSLNQSGGFTIYAPALERIRAEFDSGAIDEAATEAMMRKAHAETGELIDPHTAVALQAATRTVRTLSPTVVLATAHPAKFPDAVERATGVRPGLPPQLADLFDREERIAHLPNDLAAVQNHISLMLRHQNLCPSN